ncbi:unnamed protein product [Lota lota]
MKILGIRLAESYQIDRKIIPSHSGDCPDGGCPFLLTQEQWDGKSDQAAWRVIEFLQHGENSRFSHLPQLLLTTQVARMFYSMGETQGAQLAAHVHSSLGSDEPVV